MSIPYTGKSQVQDLSYFGGVRTFTETKSTSSLVKPDFNKFIQYSEQFFKRKYYTNNGILVRLLEERLAAFHNTENCVSFCSGFWALVLAMTSLATEGKGEIIMPSLTYRRMADLAAWARLKPRFCEVDTATLALDGETIHACANEETALIMAVHPIVNCCDIESIIDAGRELNIPVLFDSVESVYESTELGRIGGFGQAECFSMHASKLLNGFEGGYLTTNNKGLAERLGKLRTYGFMGQDNCVLPNGLNAKLNEIHAAMALANLDEIDQQVELNHKRYKVYQEGVAAIPGIRLLEFDDSFRTSYKNIVIEIQEDWPLSRDETVAILNAENILARAYYSPALHQKSMSFPHIPATLETTDELAKRFILLPCGEFVSCGDIHQILQLLAFIKLEGNSIAVRMSSIEGPVS